MSGTTGQSAEILAFSDGPSGPTLGMVDRGSLSIDLPKLLATRMLIQAASGGGKSYALRRLLEQTHGLVQQIVIDPEGELVTLAEGFDYLVCGPDAGHAPIRADMGAKVADLIFESRRSAVLVLSEFEVEEMQGFARAIMRQPQERWRHVLLAIDEAQLFAPQQDKAMSKKAVLDLAARGRKRGLCPVLATQRISQLHKGVVAHLDNKLIGLTTLDVDVERAAEQLGMRAADARQKLRRLAAGRVHSVRAGAVLRPGYREGGTRAKPPWRPRRIRRAALRADHECRGRAQAVAGAGSSQRHAKRTGRTWGQCRCGTGAARR